ncbi:MAG: SulP family inorganic anion transporter, partial [Bacteroidota bacterium]|nr:SulP family inorganic anion transporter [Bacteroidota bacterium]
PDFSNKFLLMGDNESEIRSFFTDDIIRFFENNHIYHLESNGEALIIFDKIKLARTDETTAFIKYGKELSTLLNTKTP